MFNEGNSRLDAAVATKNFAGVAMAQLLIEGDDSFGTVSRVKDKENNLFYALKTIPKKPGNKSKASSVDNEVKLLTEVNH
ncbi:unnamed protein product [Rotaria socialis]|uniref:Protein kinase domain-containing protein n=1 Tax=Rotaria socialis TaxID=392032 RepID=A0A821HSA0_9BILA|nr:unnamed protein product [Rotaria socialis]